MLKGSQFFKDFAGGGNVRKGCSPGVLLLALRLACLACLALAGGGCGSGAALGAPIADASLPTQDASPSSNLDGASSPGPDASNPAPDGEAPDGGPEAASSCPSGTDAATGVTVTAEPGAGSAGETLAIDGSGPGRRFDGIGAISGGGGNSRLLYDYPEPYRSQVLDYLFKPSYGAALQILKVEVGGDEDSTDGSESSHMHTANDLSCSRGYEWWVMKEAKARNPAIKLYALAWGAPGWIGGGKFWSQDMIDYLLKWLGCAKSNGFTIDYIGGWNESGYDKTWFENLHAALASNGYAITVVGADDYDTWAVADDMTTDSAFNAAIDVVGVHYPCGGDGAPATTCAATANALALGKPLWASENGSQDYNGGAGPMIRAITRGYIDAKMTSFINWPLVAALPPGLLWETVGLVYGNQPWSGAYDVGASVWMSAHVTQFSQPGWSFVDAASGYLGGDRANGGYVTLKSSSGDYSVIVETTTATAARTVAFNVGGGLSAGGVHIWATNLGSKDAGDYFVHSADVTPSGGIFSVTLEPSYVYSMTTTSGQGKGAAASPPSSAPLLPYADGFDADPVGGLAPLLADQEGAFEVVACGGGRTGRCVRQMPPIAPIFWNGNTGTYPYTLLGTNDWADYTVTVDVLLETPGSAEIIGRYSGRGAATVSSVDGYYLSVTDAGAWSILRNSQTTGAFTVLASGSATALGTNVWHTIALSMKGSTLTASIDHAVVGTATDSAFVAGPAGLAVGAAKGAWANAQFDNLSIAPEGPLATGRSAALVNRSTGLCLDVATGTTPSGALLVQAPPSGALSQVWQTTGDGSGYVSLLNASSLLVVDAPASAPGTALDQAPPSGTAGQRFTLGETSDGYFRLVTKSGMAVSAGVGATVTLAPLDCTSNAQQWSFAGAPVTNATYLVKNHQTGFVMDVSQGSKTSGANVIAWPANGGQNQEWSLRSAAGGAFALVNENSGMALDVPGSAASGTPVDQAALGGAAEGWALKGASIGYYTLGLAGTSLVLDLQSGAQGADLVVTTKSAGTSASQEWEILPAP